MDFRSAFSGQFLRLRLGGGEEGISVYKERHFLFRNSIAQSVGFGIGWTQLDLSVLPTRTAPSRCALQKGALNQQFLVAAAAAARRIAQTVSDAIEFPRRNANAGF